MTVYVEVDDIVAYLEKAQQLGGKKIVGPIDIPVGSLPLDWRIRKALRDRAGEAAKNKVRLRAREKQKAPAPSRSRLGMRHPVTEPRP